MLLGRLVSSSRWLAYRLLMLRWPLGDFKFYLSSYFAFRSERGRKKVVYGVQVRFVFVVILASIAKLTRVFRYTTTDKYQITSCVENTN